MFKSISPAAKGLITAAIMIIVSLVIDRFHEQVDPRIQYVIYAIYLAGILWTLFSFRSSVDGTPGFGAYFSQGFRCFIVVTLAMVAFTFVFVRVHPELAETEAVNTREYYRTVEKDKTPAEIEEIAQHAKNRYPITVISLSIFRYLIIGALLTAASSALLTRRI